MQRIHPIIIMLLLLGFSPTPVAFTQDISTFSWGIIYGSDANIQKAQYEIDQLPRRLPQYRTLANLFKRRKLYASVILFRSQKDATSALSLVNIAYSGQGAFVVNIKEWCRSDWSKYQATLSGINYYDCKRGDILDGNTGVIIIKKFKTSKAAQEYLEGPLKRQFPSRQYDFVTFHLQNENEYQYQAAIINYKNQNEANKQINQIPENLREEATAVDINKFCPSMSRVPDSYYKCK